MGDETFTCDGCGRTATRAAATRTETMGDLDPDRWQTLCCPTCGQRLQTVLVRE